LCLPWSAVWGPLSGCLCCGWGSRLVFSPWFPPRGVGHQLSLFNLVLLGHQESTLPHPDETPVRDRVLASGHTFSRHPTLARGGCRRPAADPSAYISPLRTGRGGCRRPGNAFFFVFFWHYWGLNFALLARHTLYHLSHTSSSFALVILSQNILAAIFPCTLPM
jgi:hypothetical protein